MSGVRLRENATTAEEDEHLRADVDGQLGLGDEVGESGELPVGDVVELFAGPGGWDEGAHQADLDCRVVGLEWDEAACETARAAGHERIHADVAEFDPAAFLAWAVIVGLIASPPCQAWSRSGKRGGIKDQPRIFAHVAECIRAGRWIDYPRDGWHDPRSPLVLEVLRWAWVLRPRWIACEQVEDVLPFWREVARWLRGQGYSVWCGVLNAEEYGVPQTRRRAILVARRDGIPAGPPSATHRRYYPASRSAAAAQVAGDDLFGTDLAPWVSMADALGWGVDDRPAWTVTAGGTETGGAEVFGNAKCRALLRSRSLANGPMVNATVRPLDEPAGTIYCSRPGNLRWQDADASSGERSAAVTVTEAAILQGFRLDYPWQGGKSAQYRQVGDAIPPPLAGAVLATLVASSTSEAAA